MLGAEHVPAGEDATFVADPFLLPAPEGWHMFMEVYHGDRTPTAHIGHATSRDGVDWTYEGPALRTDVHNSFPYVFQWDGEYYLLPEEGLPAGEATVTLYRARSFPTKWEPVATLLAPDHETSDHVVFRRDGRWWLLVGDMYAGAVYAYYSDSLVTTRWRPHEQNPVVAERPEAARLAGRPLPGRDGLVVFYQDCSDEYGACVRAFEVTTLTVEDYRDRELPQSPVLAGTGGFGWNSGRMHHIDAWRTEDGWLCAVDGDIGIGRRYAGERWSIGVCGADPTAEVEGA